MRLASSSFMYQGETMGSRISWDLYVSGTRAKFPLHPATSRREEGEQPQVRGVTSRGNSAFLSDAHRALKSRAQYGPVKFIREILNIPRRSVENANGRAVPYCTVRGARLQGSSPRYYRGRELRASSGRVPLSGFPRPRLRPGRLKLPRNLKQK